MTLHSKASGGLGGGRVSRTCRGSDRARTNAAQPRITYKTLLATRIDSSTHLSHYLLTAQTPCRPAIQQRWTLNCLPRPLPMSKSNPLVRWSQRIPCRPWWARTKTSAMSVSGPLSPLLLLFKTLTVARLCRPRGLGPRCRFACGRCCRRNSQRVARRQEGASRPAPAAGPASPDPRGCGRHQWRNRLPSLEHCHLCRGLPRWVGCCRRENWTVTDLFR